MAVARASAGGTMPDPASIARPWLESYPPGVPETYRYPAVALPRFLDDAARDFPERPAVRYGGADLDFVALRRLVDATATGLADLGVGYGTPVALLLPNVPAFVVAAFATWRLGAVLVPIDPELPDEEVGGILAACRAEVVVGGPDVPASLASRPLPALRTVVVSDEADWRARGRIARTLRRWRPRGRPEHDAFDVVDLDDLSADDGADEHRRSVRDAAGPDDTAVIAWTGGTTGTRKGVVLSHANLVANAFQARLWVPDVQAGRERILGAVPFSHVFGLTLGMLNAVLSAAALVLPRAVDGDTLVATIAAERPTLFPTVPALLRAVVEAPGAQKADLSSLRACVSGAAPLSPPVAERFAALTGNARVREGYGLSEAGPLSHANPIYGRAQVGRIGLPVTDTVAIVVDPDDPTVVLPPGQPGELAIAGPQVMAGYFEDPEATAAVLRDGWLLTGDIVVADAAGSFTLVDRKKDVIVTDAAVVFPHEVEQVLIRHPAVAAAVVAGRPTVHGADEIVAVVVLHPGARARASELVTHCRHHLPAYAVPAHVEIRDELPRGSMGKLLRRELAD